MTKKLLQRTLRNYIVFSFIVLIVSAPLFYFFTENLYLKDADETLYLRRNEFVKFTMPTMKKSDISIWNKISKDGKIINFKNSHTNNKLFFATEYDHYTKENEPYHVLESKILIDNEKYTLVLRVNLIESEDLIISVFLLFSVILILLLTGLFIITKKLSSNLWKPFYDTLNQIEQFEIDKHKIPYFSESKIEEFHRLNDALSKLIENNIIIFKSQREFVENAAHELQTPLAIFQSTIDNLIQNPTISQDQSELLAQLNDSVSRLNRLNKNLLLLSKIDGNQYNSNELVFFHRTIEKQLEFFTEQAKSRNITINYSIQETIPLKANPVLIEILISNLFLNAIKHNHQDGFIAIELVNNSLIFSNSGQTKKLDTAKLFQRFSKINPSTHGNGLGLAIIKKISDINNWSITYDFAKNSHFFTIKF